MNPLFRAHAFVEESPVGYVDFLVGIPVNVALIHIVRLHNLSVSLRTERGVQLPDKQAFAIEVASAQQRPVFSRSESLAVVASLANRRANQLLARNGNHALLVAYRRVARACMAEGVDGSCYCVSCEVLHRVPIGVGLEFVRRDELVFPESCDSCHDVLQRVS